MSLSVVIDTNVVIDALFHNNTYAQRIINSILRNEIEFAISEPIVDEMVHTVMGHAISANLTLKQAKNPLHKIIRMLSRAKHVKPTISLEVTEHSADNKFYECAYEADVTIIISQDGHVNAPTNIKTCNNRRIKTYSPWQFIKQFKIKG